MDLSSLNPRGFGAIDPDDMSSRLAGFGSIDPDGYEAPSRRYANPNVETRVAFDENNRPYYTTVPSPDLRNLPVPVPQHQASAESAPRQVVVYQPTPQYYSPLASYNPVRDPIVMRLLAGAVAVGVGAVALSYVLAALAAAEMALGLLLGVLLLLWLLTSGKGSGGKSVNNVTITNTNKSRRWR